MTSHIHTYLVPLSRLCCHKIIYTLYFKRVASIIDDFLVHVSKVLNLLHLKVNLNWVCFKIHKFVNAFIADVSTKSDGWYVESSVTGDASTNCPPLKNCKIWTRRFQSEHDEETPLVMIHGMGAGLGFFSLNFDRLVQDRTVYAIDLPGMKY